MHFKLLRWRLMNATLKNLGHVRGADFRNVLIFQSKSSKILKIMLIICYWMLKVWKLTLHPLMAGSIVLRPKIILVCDTAVTVMEKKSHVNYCLLVILIDVLVIVVLLDVILVVSVVVHVVIIVGNHNRNRNLLLCLPLCEFEALWMFGYTSSLIAHLLTSLPFHFWKKICVFLLYSRFIGIF